MRAFLRKVDAMLVLSRKVGEDILIGKDVRIRVIAAQRGRVRLGILAPSGVEVLRAELASRAKPGKSVLQGAGAEK
jgi:carbon storage regulator CsrA